MRPRLTLLVTALLATASSPVWPAPLPRVRELPPGLPAATRLARSEHVSSVADACGTRVESVTEMVALHLARAAHVQNYSEDKCTNSQSGL